MRLDPIHADFFKTAVKAYLPDAVVYLFGSRTKDHLRGGDIDLLVSGSRQLTDQEKRNVKIAFYKKSENRKSIL